jgi:predicted metallo-beta-lactamase superfamily hydrolase
MKKEKDKNIYNDVIVLLKQIQCSKNEADQNLAKKISSP